VSNKPIIRASMIAAFTIAGGLGVSYALVLTFVAVAIIFVFGLWLYTRDDALRFPWSSHGTTSVKSGHRAQKTLTIKLVSGYLLIWWLTVILVYAQIWRISSLEESQLAESAQQGAATGFFLTQLLVICYGAIGLPFLAVAIKRSSEVLRWILVLWLIYLCWGYITLFWSIDPYLTVRRLTAFALITLGSIGLGAGFYGAQPNGRILLMRHATLAGGLAALALLIPLAFHPTFLIGLLDPSYILMLASNTYSFVAFPTAISLLMIFAAPMLDLRSWRRSDWLWVLVLMFALFVVKVRGAVLCGALALIIVYLLYNLTHKTAAKERVRQVGLLIVSSVGAYVLLSEKVLDLFLPYLTREEVSENVSSITGRVPLWDILLSDVQQHPLLGVGFGAYWTPFQLIRIRQLVGWPAVVAHNGYIDELLATGMIGLLLFVAFLAFVACVAVSKIRQGDAFGWLCLLFLLLYLLLNLTQSLMQVHLEVPLMVLFALVGLIGSNPSAKPP
jgi:exopolysaccharide production protein ExoQ